MILTQTYLRTWLICIPLVLEYIILWIWFREYVSRIRCKMSPFSAKCPCWGLVKSTSVASIVGWLLVDLPLFTFWCILRTWTNSTMPLKLHSNEEGYKEVLKIYGAWFIPNTLLTIVHSHAFLIPCQHLIAYGMSSSVVWELGYVINTQ